jgi:hypothetical protein
MDREKLPKTLWLLRSFRAGDYLVERTIEGASGVKNEYKSNSMRTHNKGKKYQEAKISVIEFLWFERGNHNEIVL